MNLEAVECSGFCIQLLLGRGSSRSSEQRCPTAQHWPGTRDCQPRVFPAAAEHHKPAAGCRSAQPRVADHHFGLGKPSSAGR